MFVGLPVLKIWLICGHSVNRPGDLDDFDLMTVELVRNISRGTDDLSANFGVSVTFHC